ncbi:MAG: hypothetical protein H7Y12_12075 [Sphingobacteriaceae bacterium]|nr:hypothetical protein [Cytophagaceae bacterium]
MLFLIAFLFPTLAAVLGPKPISSVELTLSTRGTTKTLTVSATRAVVDINGAKQSQKITPEQWKKLLDQINALDLPRLHILESPTDRSAVDAAYNATLRVTTPQRRYETASFDHPNPPKQLVALLRTLVESAPKAAREEFR